MTLRVRLEIVPYGDEDRSYEIGRLDISQSERYDLGEYAYVVIELDSENNIGGMYETKVLHHRKDGAWVLVSKVLTELVLNENKKGKIMNDRISEQMAEAQADAEARVVGLDEQGDVQTLLNGRSTGELDTPSMGDAATPVYVQSKEEIGEETEERRVN